MCADCTLGARQIHGGGHDRVDYLLLMDSRVHSRSRPALLYCVVDTGTVTSDVFLPIGDPNWVHQES
jgi:hypothetical protein